MMMILCIHTETVLMAPRDGCVRETSVRETSVGGCCGWVRTY
jgi:hypothetical protein